jgi:hypothetical protein
MLYCPDGFVIFSPFELRLDTGHSRFSAIKLLILIDVFKDATDQHLCQGKALRGSNAVGQARCFPVCPPRKLQLHRA